MNSKQVEYTDGKLNFIGRLYWDEALVGKRPGIVVFPEAFGLGEHACQRAEQLAQLGYVALAADPHGEGKVFGDLASVGPVIQALYTDRADWRSRALLALDTLIAQPQVDSSKIAAIGFCFGGTTCIELARSGAPLRAIVTFHAGLIPESPEDVGRIRASVLVCHGADDPIVKGEGISAVMTEFRRDRVDWQFNYYGNTVHSFTNPEASKNNNPALAYNPRVQKRSWMAMCNLFDEVFS
jgi:dienelactone hydrolase